MKLTLFLYKFIIVKVNKQSISLKFVRYFTFKGIKIMASEAKQQNERIAQIEPVTATDYITTESIATDTTVATDIRIATDITVATDSVATSKKKKTWKKRLFFWIILLLIICVACDSRLKTITYTFDSPKVDKPVKIALITDLHSDWYGKNQKNLIEAVKKENPDIVLLGGDIFDDKKSYENAKETLEMLSGQYPCFYVTGNHEYWSKKVGNIIDIVESYGVTVLSGYVAEVEINGQKINICGVDDPDAYVYLAEAETIEKQISQVADISNQPEMKDNYTILLSHRPELYDLYSQYDFDLVLCGHAHGGQWRIPGILNGLFAPDQGLFPEYAGGLYEYDGGTMIVSRGLARESTPAPRVFNRPELVIIELR